jgi:pyruvate/2-oxoacid:ferredoxin oxidoreductase alpha subunit
MEKLRKEYHRDPLLVRRFPRPFTKSNFEQALRKVSRRVLVNSRESNL